MKVVPKTLMTMAAMTIIATFAACEDDPVTPPPPPPPPFNLALGATVTGNVASISVTMTGGQGVVTSLTLAKIGGETRTLDLSTNSVKDLDWSSTYNLCGQARRHSDGKQAENCTSFTTSARPGPADPCTADLGKLTYVDIEFRHRPDTARFYVALQPVQMVVVCPGNTYRVMPWRDQILSGDGGVTYAASDRVPVGGTVGFQFRRTVGGNNADGGWLEGSEMVFFLKGDSTRTVAPVTKTSFTIPNGCLPPNPCSVDGVWLLKVEEGPEGIWSLSAP